MRQQNDEATVAVAILAGLRHRRLVVQIGELNDEQRALRRVFRVFAIDMDRDRSVLPLLAGPAGDEEMVAVAADAVEMADDAPNRLGRCRRCGGRSGAGLLQWTKSAEVLK
jgi:hypothetical protein